MGFTANKKILVLGVANKKDLYLGTEGVSYNIQYTHILDELTSHIMGRKEFSSVLQIICCCIHGLQFV